MWMYISNAPTELYHHGILGQKWGVRRYQNRDGSLTPAGRRRYNLSESGKLVKKTRKEIKEYDEAKRKTDTRERIMKDPKPTDLDKNFDLFTSEEIDNIVKKIRQKNTIQELADAESVRRGQKYVREADNMAKVLNSTASAISGASKAYNEGAKVVNAMFGSDLPIIGEKKESSSEKQARELARKAQNSENRAKIALNDKKLRDAKQKEKLDEEFKDREYKQMQMKKQIEFEKTAQEYRDLFSNDSVGAVKVKDRKFKTQRGPSIIGATIRRK